MALLQAVLLPRIEYIEWDGYQVVKIYQVVIMYQVVIIYLVVIIYQVVY